MKTELKNIIAGSGLDGIKFGMKRKEVEKLLGKPDEIDPSEDSDDGEDESKNELWHYDEIELSALFDEEFEWRLISLAVSSPDYLLNGESLVGITLEELQKKMNAMDLGELFLDDELETEDGVQMYGVEDAGVYFWVQDGTVTEIQWGPELDEEDVVIWPTK